MPLITSPSAARRLDAACEFTAALAPGAEALIVAATRDAADDFVRELAAARGASFGLHRFSLMQLAAHLAAPEMARLGLAPATALGSEAIAARGIADAAGQLGYFAPVAGFPGFARAVAATLAEVRFAAVSPAALGPVPPGSDLGGLLARCERQLEEADLADRARLFSLATEALRRDPARFAGWPMALLDVAVDAGREADLVGLLLERAGAVLVTVPAGDARTLAELGRRIEVRSDDEHAPGTALEQLHQYLFAEATPPARAADDTVTFFSAPGEARECVEIARYAIEQARAGVPFDRMAVFLRAPLVYAPLLETAFRRASIPAFFARGTTRPDPSGRALLALLACREEGLSASRFAEYLSLAQVPAANETSPTEEAIVATDETLRAVSTPTVEEPATEAEEDDLAATPRAPWKWEELLVDAAVIGGKDRWRRRLDGLEQSLRLQLEATREEEPDSPRATRLEREIGDLAHLRGYALPLIERLDALPAEARWGEWLPPLRALVQAALRKPARVLSVLAELEPMAGVGPVAIGEVARVLGERLSVLERDPPPQRYGRIFVAPAAHARARSFDVVFVPGLAERIFPQRPREDPLLLDGLRREVSGDLRTQEERGQEERLLLALAVGAAEKRVFLSYPRVDVGEARPRVTSFYGLDVVRATRGEIPDPEELERDADAVAGARLAWPAPLDAARAIDVVEHDLAVLGPLLRSADLSQAKGRARYLLELNPWLGRSLRSRYARWQRRQWRSEDGLIRPDAAVRALLDEHRLRKRAYSASALQRFAACPYQFLLAAIYRFEPREEPAPLEQLNPLERGKLFHQVQAETLRQLRDADALPLTLEHLSDAEDVLIEVVDRVAEEYRDRLAPPIERVWRDEMEALRADLRIWLRRMAEAGDDWRPLYFELGFGLPPDPGRDAASRREEVVLTAPAVPAEAEGARLRGSVDLVEESRDGVALRVTDHKTGRDSTPPGLVVGAGEVLQPVLYALAVEAATGRPVRESRLYYCTTRGAFAERQVPINAVARERAAAVLGVVDRAIESGSFPPAPREEACRWCDFRSVCGPYEEMRVRTKDQDALADLLYLRGLP